ncbi:crotonase/enoyl-CoA hydratase family protein [Microbacterium sp. CPCC 204701]|uniref:crotonase/enoyl-CoA hydratase family protein n=1 Tax=Microbacterium sp. CPCC 204701 TaxID=2493084 RepID=UPI000FD88C4B|nr:crotonase/enoyl-CoA hydratase family protein [Microbacterium sp. CPCC 204701]
MAQEEITLEIDDDIAMIGINRPEKRNALHSAMFVKIGEALETAGLEAKAAVIYGVGDHFSAGLDLAQIRDSIAKDPARRLQIGPNPAHVAFDRIQRGRIPVVAALTGAVIGAGLEVAASAHIRVADDTAFFGLPEAQRGIFVGAGGSVRIQRLIGTARMTDMMLTGRILSADEAVAQNLVQYVVDSGRALHEAVELARKIASNTPESNWAITQGLSRINDLTYDDGLFFETLVARSAVSASSHERLTDFVEKRSAPLARPAAGTRSEGKR